MLVTPGQFSEQSDHLFCPYCKEHVSRSTYRRHQLMTVKRKREISSSSDSNNPSNYSSESSSDDALDPRIPPPDFFISVDNGK